MSYALNLAEDGRYLSAGDPSVWCPEGVTVVDSLPTGETEAEKDPNNWRYVDGEWLFDPLAEPSQYKTTAPRNIVAGEYVTVNGTLYKATANIPRGEPIITGQNAVETTIEQQLHELTKGE